MDPETKTAVFGYLLLISLTQVYGKERAKTLGDLEATEDPDEKHNIIQGYVDPTVRFGVPLVDNPYVQGWTPFCTGIILNSHFILTAGHCIRLTPRATFVGNASDVYSVQPLKLIRSFSWLGRHKKPSMENIHLDVGFYITDDDIAFTDQVQPASLMYEPITNLNRDTHCYVGGWGPSYERSGLHYPSHITFERAFILSQTACRRYMHKVFNITIDDSVICTQSPRLCSGDSGGPLVCELGGRQVVVGINLATIGAPFLRGNRQCSLPDRPTLYASIPYHYGNIRKASGYRDPNGYRELHAPHNFITCKDRCVAPPYYMQRLLDRGRQKTMF